MLSVGLFGSILHVLASNARPDTLNRRDPRRAGFSFGLGGLAGEPEPALAALGELWTAPGQTAVLEANHPGQPRLSNGSPDSLFTPFNVLLEGIDAEAARPLPSMASETWRADALWRWWVESARREGSEAALFGAVYLARIESLRGSWVKRCPTPENAPTEGRPIIDPEWRGEWFGVAPDGGAKGAWALVVGVALDTSAPGIAALGGRERDIFYHNPGAPAGQSALQIHQHALILEGVEPPKSLETIEAISGRALATGRARDVKHVLDDTLFRGGVGSCLPAAEIAYLGKRSAAR